MTPNDPYAMSFFPKAFIEDVPELLRGYLGNPVPGSLDKGPTLVVTGDWHHLVPSDILDEAYRLSLEMGDGTPPFQNQIFQESLLKMKENTIKASIKDGMKLLGLRSSFYAKTDLDADEMSSYPFHANEGSQSFIREVDALAWDSIGAPGERNLKWLASYEPAHNPGLYSDHIEREECFLYEDLYDYIKKNGAVTLLQSVSGEIKLDAGEDKYEDAKLCGIRDGYYEMKSLYERADEFQSSDVDGLKLLMRKEAYLVIPFKKLVFEFAPDVGRKYNSTSFRVFPFNENRLFLAFLNNTPFPSEKDPALAHKDETAKKKRNSLFSRQFKK